MFLNRLNAHLQSHENIRNEKLTEFCEDILTKSDSAYFVVIRNFPEFVIQIAWKYWRKKYIKNIYEEHDFDKVEHDCGLSTSFDYISVSFLQTPTYQLLLATPLKTVDFIVDFTNECIHNYVSNNPNKLEILQLSFSNGNSVC